MSVRTVVWLAVAAAIVTILFGTIYVVAQQAGRSGADDAPMRLLSQLRDDQGSAGRVDLATSLVPFEVSYDEGGRAVSGDAYLDGRLASIPVGVVKNAWAFGEDRVTWQPRDDLRFAIVAERDGNRVKVAGQSLVPVEARADKLLLLVAAGWGACIAVLGGGALVSWLLGRYGRYGRRWRRGVEPG